MVFELQVILHGWLALNPVLCVVEQVFGVLEPWSAGDHAWNEASEDAEA